MWGPALFSIDTMVHGWYYLTPQGSKPPQTSYPQKYLPVSKY